VLSLQMQFDLMVDYNQWMTNNIFDAVSQSSPSEISTDRGAFFGSIIGTLNHILVSDIIWLKRFAEHPYGFKSLDPVRTMSRPKSLDSIL